MASAQTKVAVRLYFHKIVVDHTDSYTGEVNTTAMAEEAAVVFNLDGSPPECEIPEWVYEYAVDVAEVHRDDEM